MTKTARQILLDYAFETATANERGDGKRWYSAVDQALKELEAIMQGVIGEDFDIPAEMEKVGRDFQKLDAIAKTGGLLNNHKSELRKRLHTALYGEEK